MKYAFVSAACGGSNHTPPGPDFFVQKTRSAAGAGLPSSETAAESVAASGRVADAAAASVTAGAALPASAATRVTVTSSLAETPRSEIVRRNTYAPTTGSVARVTAAAGCSIVAPSPPAGAETSVQAISPA